MMWIFAFDLNEYHGNCVTAQTDFQVCCLKYTFCSFIFEVVGRGETELIRLCNNLHTYASR